MRKITALICIVTVILGIFSACGKTPSPTVESNNNTTAPTATPVSDATEAPSSTPDSTPTATATAAPTPTAKATATPEPTPDTDKWKDDISETLYTWEYKEYEEGKIEVVIVPLVEGDELKKLKRVVVPSEIDGKKVTKIPYDFFGCRYPMFGGRKGFMVTTKSDVDGNPIEWNDYADCWVEEVVFPNTIEEFGNGVFWFNVQTLTSLVFEDNLCNLKKVLNAPFSSCPAEENYAKAHGGFIVLNGILVYAGQGVDIVFPDDVKVVGPQAFYNSNGSWYKKVKTITINEGCEEIQDRMIDGMYIPKLESVYIPASVTKIGKDIIAASAKEKVVIKVIKDSYAEQWAKDNDFKYEIVTAPND